jgi:hypothetical protein
MPLDGKKSQHLPDFIIIGAAKSGTTSLFMWLTDQPEVSRPRLKEPDFFSKDRTWRRGFDWYGGVLSGAEPATLLGEASTSYTELKYRGTAAARIAETVPDVKLIYVLRHPVERLRSHYRHEVQKGRELLPLAEAVARPENEYVGSSLYFTCLDPYIRLFRREQICVVRFEDLVKPPATAWSAVLAHLGLSNRALPGDVYNRTADKPGYTRAMLRLYELGLLRPVKYLPGPVRKLGKLLMTRDQSDHAQQLDQSLMPLPGVVETQIWEDVSRLEDWLGVDDHLWERAPLEQESRQASS